MAKHDFWFRLQVVQSYRAGDKGYVGVAREHGLDKATVRKWVQSYELHGETGLKPKHSRYSAQFKLDVLQSIAQEQLSHTRACARFGLRGGTGVIAAWQRQYHEGGLEALKAKRKGRPPNMKTNKPASASVPSNRAQSEMPDAQRSLQDVLKENEYLRAEVAYLKIEGLAPGKRASSAEKARLVLELRPKHRLAVLLQVATLSRSTFYYQCAASAANDPYDQLKEQICAIFEGHKRRYGYRRVHLELRNRGHSINHKLVHKLMQQMGLKSPVRAKKYNSWRGDVHTASPNVLARQFNASAPNQKWVTDVTEFNVNGSKLYLSPVLDLYNGEIIAHEMQGRPHYSLVGNMLEKALVRLGQEDKPIMHSDQGWHYRMPDYRKTLGLRGIEQSMSRKANCLDNAAMESFFGTLKSELFHLEKFTTVQELRQSIDEYIHYYNHQRIKVKLRGLSPVQYRTQPKAA